MNDHQSGSNGGFAVPFFAVRGDQWTFFFSLALAKVCTCTLFNTPFPPCGSPAPQWSHLQPQHPRGQAGEATGAPADAVDAVPQAAPRLRQMQGELLRDGLHTSGGETRGHRRDAVMFC